jgi:hypothetical protein
MGAVAQLNMNSSFLTSDDTKRSSFKNAKVLDTVPKIMFMFTVTPQEHLDITAMAEWYTTGEICNMYYVFWHVHLQVH